MESESPLVQTSPVYLVWNGELSIHAPPARVWPLALAYADWQNYAVNDRISGACNEEGEVVLLKKIEAGFDFPPYYARTVKLDPQRRVIWKTYAHESSTMGFIGFVEFVLTPESGGTRFNYNILYEFMIEHADDAALETFRRTQFDSSQAVFDAIFPRLKMLSEDGAK